MMAISTKLVGYTMLGFACGTVPTAGFAQSDWPTHSIRVIVPYAAGGNGDTVARMAAHYMEQALGQTVVVENRPGAGGILGTEQTVHAAPDGYTFCMCSIGAVSVAPIADPNVSYDPLTDLAPVSWVSANPLVVIANPQAPFADLDEMIAYAKENPGEVTYASSGVGGLMHFSVDLFQNMTGTVLTHIPYTGGAPATAAVLSGETDITFTHSSDTVAPLAEGLAKGIAVSSAERTALMEDLPAIAEIAPGYDVMAWNALMAPAGTPPEIIEKLAQVIADMAQDLDIQARMETMGVQAVSNTPEEFYASLQQEVETWNLLFRDEDQ